MQYLLVCEEIGSPSPSAVCGLDINAQPLQHQLVEYVGYGTLGEVDWVLFSQISGVVSAAVMTVYLTAWGVGVLRQVVMGS